MDYSVYVGKCVKIEVLNNIYYIGVVLEADETFLVLKDKKGARIVLKDAYILSVREILNET